jgi:hypothetical protein
MNATLLQMSIDFAAPMHEQHVIGAKRAIHQQLAAPMTVRLLLAQKIFLRTADCLRNPGVGRGV